MDGLNFQEQMTLDLMKAHATEQRDTSHLLDEKAKENLNLASIVATLTAALNVGGAFGSQVHFSALDQRILLSVYLLYTLIFALTFLARKPRRRASHPLNPTWDEALDWTNLSIKDYYLKLLATYEAIYAKNARTAEYKALLIQITGFSIFVEVALVGLTAFV